MHAIENATLPRAVSSHSVRNLDESIRAPAGSLASLGPSLRSFLFFMLGDTIEENVEHPVG